MILDGREVRMKGEKVLTIVITIVVVIIIAVICVTITGINSILNNLTPMWLLILSITAVVSFVVCYALGEEGKRMIFTGNTAIFDGNALTLLFFGILGILSASSIAASSYLKIF